MLTLYKEEEQTQIRGNIQTFLEESTQREGYDIWMVLEVARDEEIAFFLGQYETAWYYLFDDEEEALQESGAVAFRLNDLPETFSWIARHWGKGWFSFFVTNHTPQEVVSHLSSLCYLQTEQKRYLFRYYDPVTFASWIGGLKEVDRIDEALGIFLEVYVESTLPHILMQYTIKKKSYRRHALDLHQSLNGFARPLPKKTATVPLSSGVWLMEQKEYEYLAPVPLNAFKIKLCKTLTERYALLSSHTLAEVYDIIDTQTARAVKHGIRRKYLLAQFIEICFEYQDFWDKYQTNIEKVLVSTTLSEVDKIETIIEAATRSKE